MDSSSSAGLWVEGGVGERATNQLSLADAALFTTVTTCTASKTAAALSLCCCFAFHGFTFEPGFGYVDRSVASAARVRCALPIHRTLQIPLH